MIPNTALHTIARSIATACTLYADKTTQDFSSMAVVGQIRSAIDPSLQRFSMFYLLANAINCREPAYHVDYLVRQHDGVSIRIRSELSLDDLKITGKNQ